LIEEALKNKNLKYITDMYGNNPLVYALKKKSKESLNYLIEFYI